MLSLRSISQSSLCARFLAMDVTLEELKSMSQKCIVIVFSGVIILLVNLISACSSVSDLSGVPPYNRYAGKNVVLVSPMPVEYDFKQQKPSKIVSAGTRVTIKHVFLEKTKIRGPI